MGKRGSVTDRSAAKVTQKNKAEPQPPTTGDDMVVDDDTAAEYTAGSRGQSPTPAPEPQVEETDEDYPDGLKIGPDGKPTCFGEYDDDVYPCHSCPVAHECQLKLLDL